MICKKCQSDCIMDEWDGWKWVCLRCGATRRATKEEIEEYEKEKEIIEKKINSLTNNNSLL